MKMVIKINEGRLKNTFIELVGVPCPSCDAWHGTQGGPGR